MFFVTFFIGVLMNFLGYIPLGNINLTVVKLSINRGMRQVYYFIVSFAIVEFFFTFGIMKFVEWFANESNLLRLLDWIMIVVFLVMAYVTWKDRHQLPKEDYSKSDSIKLGVLLAIVNPMQIPFWLIGGSYVVSHQWIETSDFALSIFSAGSSLGSFLALFLFAKFARYIQDKFTLSSSLINKSIAVLFFCLALYHIGKMVYIYFIK